MHISWSSTLELQLDQSFPGPAQGCGCCTYESPIPFSRLEPSAQSKTRNFRIPLVPASGSETSAGWTETVEDWKPEEESLIALQHAPVAVLGTCGKHRTQPVAYDKHSMQQLLQPTRPDNEGDQSLDLKT